MKREGALQKDFEPQANTFLELEARDVRLKSPVTFAEFKLWYQEKMSKAFVLDEIDSEASAPQPKGSYVQRLSHHISQIRNARTLRTIASSLNEHKIVMVVYGGSHLTVQAPALEDMLGKPVSYQ